MSNQIDSMRKEHEEALEDLARRHRESHPWQHRLGSIYNYLCLYAPFCTPLGAAFLAVAYPNPGSFTVFAGTLLSVSAHIRQRFFTVYRSASSSDSDDEKAGRDRETVVSLLWGIFNQLGVVVTAFGLVLIAAIVYGYD